MNPAQKLDHVFKVVLAGDIQVGKTNLLQQYCKRLPNPQEKPTIGAEFMISHIYVDNISIKLQLWDISGQERSRSIVATSFRGENGCILVYDITKRSSFLNLQNWYNQFFANVPVILVGNKADLEEKREVSYEEAKAFGQKIGAKVIETSAMHDKNIEDIFSTIVRQIIVKVKKDSKENSIPIKPVEIQTEPVKTGPRPLHGHGNNKVYKMTLVGDTGVGKSNMIQQLCDSGFYDDHIPTIGVNFQTKTIPCKDKNINLQIWDLGGQTKFKSLTQNYCQGVQLIIFVYDITNRQSFMNLNSWLQEVGKSHELQALKVVIGNKNDLEEHREVSFEEGEAYAESIESLFFEISVRDADKFKPIFLGLLEIIFETLDAENRIQK